MSCAIRPRDRAQGVVSIGRARAEDRRHASFDCAPLVGELPLIGVGFADAAEADRPEKDRRLFWRRMAVVGAWVAGLIFVGFAIAVAWGFSR